jgi:hypothetical protein
MGEYEKTWGLALERDRAAQELRMARGLPGMAAGSARGTISRVTPRPYETRRSHHPAVQARGSWPKARYRTSETLYRVRTKSNSTLENRQFCRSWPYLRWAPPKAAIKRIAISNRYKIQPGVWKRGFSGAVPGDSPSKPSAESLTATSTGSLQFGVIRKRSLFALAHDRFLADAEVKWVRGNLQHDLFARK